MIAAFERTKSAWRRRSVRDAMAIAAICVATFIAADAFDLFDRLYAFSKEYEAYEPEELIVVTFVFGLLMLLYSQRRAQDMKLEIGRRKVAESEAAGQASMMTMIFKNIPQGILMFDSHERLVFCNDHYLEMYGLSLDAVKPGMTLFEILKFRAESGLFLPRDIERVRAKVLADLAANKSVSHYVRMRDGREIAITSNPMANGGWIATHEDRTESRRREESFRLLFDNNPVAMWLFDSKTLRYLAVNDAAVALYGYSRKQFLAMRVTQIRAGDAAISEAFIRALPKTLNTAIVGQHRRADGTVIHVTICSRMMLYEGHEARLVAINDITARKLAEDELQRTKKFLDTVIENVPVPIVVKTAEESRFTLLNKAGEELFGCSRDTVIGKTPYDIYHKARAEFVVAHDREALLSDTPIIIPDHFVPTLRGDRVVMSKKVAIHGDDGRPEYVLTLIDDVTERRDTERRIAHMAHSDALTDLPNRAAFADRLTETLKLAEAERRSFAIVCMDLDGFKVVNDIYGHAVGDSLLCQIANRLRAVAAGVFVARLGGDEFTIIAANDDIADIVSLTDRLLAAFVEDFEVDGHWLPQALSIGVAIYPTDGADIKTLLNNADAALYRAKADGAVSVQFFKAEMATRLHERSVLRTDLESAIRHDELRLHYQPQLTIAGEITGFEALARWQSPARGIVPPSEFIPLAEESNLILLLGEWGLREACREAASWDKPLNIAINVSPIQFRRGDLPSLVHSILLETGLAPGRLELEITEGVLIDDFSRALSLLRRLKSLGVRIALDDFGKGYSSLSYLRAFPFDKIKIDRSFIADLECNLQSIAIVQAVIGLGRSLNIPVLAEGVETKAQHAFLAQEGVNEVQGYLTGRPLAIEDYAGIVHARLSADPPVRIQAKTG